MSRFRLALVFRNGDEAHLTLAGRVDHEDARHVAALVDTLVEAGARQVFVDLTEVDSCDPSLVDFLGRLRRQVGHLDGWMVIDGHPAADENPPSLEEVFTVYRRVAAGDEPEAVRPRHRVRAVCPA